MVGGGRECSRRTSEGPQGDVGRLYGGRCVRCCTCRKSGSSTGGGGRWCHPSRAKVAVSWLCYSRAGGCGDGVVGGRRECSRRTSEGPQGDVGRLYGGRCVRCCTCRKSGSSTGGGGRWCHPRRAKVAASDSWCSSVVVPPTGQPSNDFTSSTRGGSVRCLGRGTSSTRGGSERRLSGTHCKGNGGGMQRRGAANRAWWGGSR